MKVYVIDTSVVVKWFFPEPFQEESYGYLSNAIFRISPSLLKIEFYSAVNKKEKSGNVRSQKADIIRSDLFNPLLLINTSQVAVF